MLTKDDASQIRKIIREEVRNEVKDSQENSESRMLDHRMAIHRSLDEVNNRVINLQISNRKLEAGQGKLRKQIDKVHKSLKKEIKQVSNFLDKENLSTLARVKRVEEHLNLPPPRFPF